MPDQPVSYRIYPDRPDDFEARIRILTPEEGGRKLPTYNGIRWNFRYDTANNNNYYFPIYPDFYYPETGNSWQEDLPLPVNEWLFARMYSIESEHSSGVHQNFMRSGATFYGCEGSRIVAEGTVTRITGLFEDRQ